MARSHTGFFSKFGRGVVATRAFQKNEVVIDYHGQVFLKTSMDKVSAIEGVKQEFCLEIKGPGRRVINASAETCPVHPDSRCMGRLANHSVLEANMKSTDVIVLPTTINVMLSSEQVKQSIPSNS